ncbi:MAG TPA: YihY/virulence factor BrkB family protein [Polyangiaceae bacterium]|nr:YihY/virulence factor BrkB family protein [Polyangiaceae bacterium]
MSGSSSTFNRISTGFSPRAVKTALSDAAERWSDAEAYRLSAALSFYALSSIFPLMLVAVSVGELVLGASAEVRGTLISALDATNSETVRGLLEDTLEGVQAAAPRSHWGVVVGVLGALFGASGIFLELETALNKLFRVPQVKRSFWQDIVNTLRERAAALGLVMVTSAIVLFGTLLLAGADVLAARLPTRWAGAPGLVSNLSSLALTTLALTLCYRVIPGKNVGVRKAALGALVAGLGLLVVRWPLTFAVVHLTSYAAYGVVGVLLLLMTWLYVASNIMMFGAALAATLDEQTGKAGAPSVEAGSKPTPDSRVPSSVAL